jgi:hypothetical protein
MAALSGTGALRHAGLTLPGLRPDAFAAIAQRPGGGAPQKAEITGALRGTLDRPAAAPPAEIRLSLGGGVIRTAPVAMESGPHAVTAGASFDLRQMQFTGRMTFADRQAPKDWSGAPPQAAFLWRGPLNGLRLDVEADELTNGLTALAIRRETERIEALEQDQRERGFFNRRLRAAEDERRAEEEARRRELLARVRAEQQRAEERRKAEEAARAAPALPPPISILPPPGSVLPNTAR